MVVAIADSTSFILFLCTQIMKVLINILLAGLYPNAD